MTWARAAAVLVAVLAAGALLVSGSTSSDPRTPAGLPGLPPPFLGTALVGDGELTAAIDAYGAVVDLRPSPAGPALIDNPTARQTAGTVAPGTGIVPRLHLGDGRTLPFWRADAVSQRYLAGTNVLATTARFGRVLASVTYAAPGQALACLTAVTAAGARVSLQGRATGARLYCDDARARTAIATAAAADRRWLGAAASLGAAAPAWATRMYRRSLLVLRAATDRRRGGVAAGARDGWAYVWPRDAAAAALAFGAAGYRREARGVAAFLRGLDLSAAARFHGNGSPVPGREAQGDAAGWVAAARAGGLPPEAVRAGEGETPGWRDRPDYQEKAPGDYLGNAIASTATASSRHQDGDVIAAAFASAAGLSRAAADPGSGVDSAAAWAVRPFPLPRLFPEVRASLRELLARGSRFGIVPSTDWPEADPWTAPTAWSAWAFAALARGDGPAPRRRADRRAALILLADLRRAATQAGALPERVGVRTGTPHSTTPLAWSHAFAVLALRELWPRRGS